MSGSFRFAQKSRWYEILTYLRPTSQPLNTFAKNIDRTRRNPMTTVNEKTGEITVLADLDDEALLAQHEVTSAWLDQFTTQHGQERQEIFKRLKETGAKKLYGKGLEFEDTTGLEYDRTQLAPIAEVFTPAELEKCLTPAHWTEPEWVEDKYNMTPFKTAVKNHGAQAALDRITFRGTPKGKLVKS